MARENAEIVMKCGRCLQQVALGEMKYAKDGKTLICQKCRGLSLQEHLDKLKQKNQAQAAPSPRPVSGSETRYKCTSCSFSFSRKSIKPQRCPYCAKPTVVEAGSISGSRLLEETE